MFLYFSLNIVQNMPMKKVLGRSLWMSMVSETGVWPLIFLLLNVLLFVTRVHAFQPREIVNVTDVHELNSPVFVSSCQIMKKVQYLNCHYWYCLNWISKGEAATDVHKSWNQWNCVVC